ncbi:hypothetical protein MUP77_02325 [Candidatus Bathyarchaeota archaeon]|nr:hypothetical protein [Candidatus Bathyarchaeota archaeon]
MTTYFPNIGSIESNYVKEKIRGRSFRDEKFLKYIDDLRLLEVLILKGPDGACGHPGKITLASVYAGNTYSRLQLTYRTEWEAMIRELKPERAPSEIESIRIWELRRAEERRQEDEVERKKMEEALKAWLSFGGLE